MSTAWPPWRWWGVTNLMLLRCWPTTRQANRSDTRNRARRASAALSHREVRFAVQHREVRFAVQHRSGLRSFPRLTPTASPGLRLEHRLLQLWFRQKLLKSVVLPLQPGEPLGFLELHPAVELAPAVVVD